MIEDQRTQFIARLATLRPDDPLLLGIAGISDDLVRDAMLEGSRMGLTGDDRAFLAGRVSSLNDFATWLASAITEAQTPPSEQGT